MGEMADYYLSLDDEDDFLFEYRQGSLTTPEAYDLGLIDENGFEIRSRGPRPLTCRHCGKTGLVWKQFPQGWRTTDPNTGQMHDCPAFKRTP